MKQLKLSIVLTLIMFMTVVNMQAYDVAAKNADGVTIYYNYINNNTELQVIGSGYNVPVFNIPSKVNGIPVTSIERDVFCNNTTVTTINIGSCLKKIRSDALYYDNYHYCSSLREIIAPDDNPNFTSIDGVLYNKVKDSLVCYPFAKPDETWTTPSTMRTMSSLFNYVNAPLKEITFTGAMEIFYTPGYCAERTDNVKMIFKHGMTSANTGYNKGVSTCDYYVPKGTLSSFLIFIKKDTGSHIYEVEGDVVWSETNFVAPTDFTTYYDYDGDGVMEYYSCSSVKDGNNYNIHSYGFFDKNGVLKEKMDEKRISSSFSAPSIPYIAIKNGNGDLLPYWKYAYDTSLLSIGGDYNYILLADIDNDGRKDLVGKDFSTSKFIIDYQQLDGTFLSVEQSATLDAEAAANAANRQGGGGVVSFADGMMVKAPKRRASSSNRAVEFVGSGSSYETGACMGIDMNEDGVLDLLNCNSRVFYSYADNKYFISDKKRTLFPCDLNGDSELDYICYDGTNIILQVRTSGTEYNEKTLFTNSNVKQIIYKDFDHDGDVDILVYINTSSTTYFVFFRNDGDLTFKRKERNFEINYQLQGIKDVDADGLYEMLVVDHTNKVSKVLKINTDLSVSESDFDVSDRFYDRAIGDFDNDGKMDYRYAIAYNSGVKFGNFSQAVNTAPKKMKAPTAVLNAETGRLRINWQQGEDTETSACDLTYELRIGTQPASGDVLFGASLADGRRRLLDDGNMGRSLNTLFNTKSMKPGTYYISVQAIDGGGRGGAWSDDFVYEHQLMAPVIVSNYTKQMSTADTLQLSVKAPIVGAIYQWTLSEGELLKSEGSNAECIFHHDGPHTINLAMTIDGRTLYSEPLTINVDPAKWVKLGRNPGFVDINQDGYPEYLGYVNDGQGNLDKVLLSYVTNIPSGTACYMDYNMDGYPDAIVKNNVYINAGDQDNDFDMETQTFDWKYYLNESSSTYIDVSQNVSIKSMWFDANNDGYLDNRHCFNDGTNIVWRPYYFADSKYKGYNSNVKWVNGTPYYYIGYPNYDVNRDGMLDIVAKGNIDGKNCLYVMYKDSTSNFNYTEPQLLFETDYGGGCEMDDINNDGYMDIVFLPSRKETTLVIVKGSASLPYTDVVTYELPVKFKEFGSLRDYNNDGYLDLSFIGYEFNYDNSKKYLFKFGPDFSGECIDDKNLRPGSEVVYENYFMVQKDGGYPDGYDSHITNQPPSAPATVAAKQTKDGLLITWSDAQDDHTPAMQMRYNISVKRKGKKGDNSFVISPMNGLKDAATICGTVMYKKSTQMLVPASVLKAGETYEIQVQAIDLWNQHSPMTQAVEFAMTSEGYIDMAEQVTVGKETTVKFVGTNASSYSLNAGTDGTIVKDEGNGSYIVKWTSEGVKNVTLTAGTKTIKSTITVVKPIDLTFTVPAQAFAGAPLTISVSDEMAAEPKDVGLRILNNNKVVVDYLAGSKTAVVTFPTTGTYELEAYSTDDLKGGSYKQTVNVTAMMPTPAIEQVDVEDGYYAVRWNTSALPAGIGKVIVSKEGSSLGEFREIETVSASAGYCIDKSSNPAMQASRYRIQLLADNGQTSEMSDVHKPLHVMIANAVQGYNLIWDNYEGINVANYNILRGSTPDNMQQIAQVAGSINSYTDTSAPAGVNYYSITFVKDVAAHSARMRASSVESVSSNTISTEEAIDVVAAMSIEIIVLDEDKTLSDSHKDLQLYYLLLPTYSTINKVQWEIIDGADLATIDANGKLHATGGYGQVVVRATTIDGSALSSEITIPTTATGTESTGIKIITSSITKGDEGRYYNLSGQRVEHPKKGLYIVNGRKVVIK